MKKVYALLSIIAVILLLIGVQTQLFLATPKTSSIIPENANQRPKQSPLPARKILVAYFSYSGNTRELANHIHTSVGGDIFEIQTVEPYPSNYFSLVKQAKEERESGYKPTLKTKIENIESYDVILIGAPVWGGTIPQPIVAFLSEYDLSGKTVVPFCTHSGSGQGQSFTDIEKLSPRSTVFEGFAMDGNKVRTAQPEISKWLSKIQITE